MVLSFLFTGKKRRKIGDKLYCYVRDASRLPSFYGPGRVPDTVDGRFDVLVVHAFLVMRALRHAKPESRIDQWLFDAMFVDLDSAIRELGASDTVVGKRIKDMAKGFYGRSASYHQVLESGDHSKVEAIIRRNLLSDGMEKDFNEGFSKDLAHWFEESNTRLMEQNIDALVSHGPAFASLHGI